MLGNTGCGIAGSASFWWQKNQNNLTLVMNLQHCLAGTVTHAKTKLLSCVWLGMAIILFILSLYINFELQSNLWIVQQAWPLCYTDGLISLCPQAVRSKCSYSLDFIIRSPASKRIVLFQLLGYHSGKVHLLQLDMKMGTGKTELQYMSDTVPS